MKKMKRIYRKPFMKPVELKDCGALLGTASAEGPEGMGGGDNDPIFDDEE